jgi:hypothetical protein
MRSLEECLLRAELSWRIGFLSWQLFQPQRGVRLYSWPRRWADKQDRKVRNRMLELIQLYHGAKQLAYDPSAYVS